MKCIESFRTEISEIRQLHILYNPAREIFPRYSHVLKNSTESKYWFQQERIDQIGKNGDARSDTNNKALFLMAWGSFEQFVRHLIREGAETRNKLGWGGHAIPEVVFNQHALVCSSILSADIRGETKFVIQRTEVATDLCGLICSTPTAKLNSDALSSFGGKFSHDQLEVFGKRIGVNLAWAEIGSDKGLRDLSSKNGKVAVGEWAEKSFCNIRDTRNKFAHRGVGEDTFGWDKAEEYIAFLDVLANAVATIVHDTIIKFKSV